MTSLSRRALLGTLTALTVMYCGTVWAEPYSDAVLADSPFAYYRIEDASSGDGETAADSSGNSHHGSYSNQVALVPGAAGNGADFSDAGIDYIGLPKSFNEFGNSMSDGAFATEFWIRTTQTTRTGQTLGGDGNEWFLFETNRAEPGHDGGNLDVPKFSRFTFRAGGNDYMAAVDSNDPKNIDIYDGQWHHVVWNVRDMANNITEAWYDGQQQTLLVGRAEGPSISGPLSGTVEIGTGYNRDTDRLLDGALDEVAFYGEPLSEARIQNHFAAIPEPSTMVLLLCGAPILILLTLRRR